MNFFLKLLIRLQLKEYIIYIYYLHFDQFQQKYFNCWTRETRSWLILDLNQINNHLNKCTLHTVQYCTKPCPVNCTHITVRLLSVHCTVQWTKPNIVHTLNIKIKTENRRIYLKWFPGENYLKCANNNLVHGEWISVKWIRLVRE